MSIPESPYCRVNRISFANQIWLSDATTRIVKTTYQSMIEYDNDFLSLSNGTENINLCHFRSFQQHYQSTKNHQIKNANTI